MADRKGDTFYFYILNTFQSLYFLTFTWVKKFNQFVFLSEACVLPALFDHRQSYLVIGLFFYQEPNFKLEKSEFRELSVTMTGSLTVLLFIHLLYQSE